MLRKAGLLNPRHSLAFVLDAGPSDVSVEVCGSDIAVAYQPPGEQRKERFGIPFKVLSDLVGRGQHDSLINRPATR
jgi:hypothetical protein